MVFIDLFNPDALSSYLKNTADSGHVKSQGRQEMFEIPSFLAIVHIRLLFQVNLLY